MHCFAPHCHPAIHHNICVGKIHDERSFLLPES